MSIIIAGTLGPVQYDLGHWNVAVYYDVVIVTSLRQENLNHYIVSEKMMFGFEAGRYFILKFILVV